MKKISTIVDLQSVKIYDSLIKYKKTLRTSELITSGYNMYIHPKISVKAGRIVDCGAFTGDTLNLFKKEFPGATYAGIEPSLANYSELSAVADDKDLLYNCAVGDCCKEVFLDTSQEMNSVFFISSTYQTPVKQMTLDVLFDSMTIDFLKMDIEGAELMALKGGGVQYDETDLFWQSVCIINQVI